MGATRWEWRTFGSTFGRAEAAFAALEPTGVQESDELYVLSPDPAAGTVKVRAALMDVKTLREVDADGLERWEPTMKAAFPVSADDLRGCAGRPARRAGSRRSPMQPTSTRCFASSRPTGAPTGRGPQAARPLHRRRLQLGVHRRHGRWSPRPDDRRSSPRTRRPSSLPSDRSASNGYRQHELPARARRRSGERRRRASPSSTSARTRSSSISASGTPTAPGIRVVDRAEVTRLGEGLARPADARPGRSSGRSSRSAAWSTRRGAHGVAAIAAVGTAGLRARRNSGRGRRRHPRTRTGVAVEIISGRGGRPSRLPRGEGRARPGARARSSCSTPAAGARSSRSGTRDRRRRAVQRAGRRGPLHRALRP